MLDSINPLHKVKTIFHNEVKRYEKNNDSETAMAIAQLYEAMITGENHKRNDN